MPIHQWEFMEHILDNPIKNLCPLSEIMSAFVSLLLTLFDPESDYGKNARQVTTVIDADVFNYPAFWVLHELIALLSLLDPHNGSPICQVPRGFNTVTGHQEDKETGINLNLRQSWDSCANKSTRSQESLKEL